MKLEQSFEVKAPLERVWQALIDVERVAPCLPGAEVTGRNDDGSYDGTFKVKIGPTAAAYSGKLHMEDVDESAHRATMNAQGTDRRGQGGAKATIISSVAPAGEGATRVEVSTDYHITGRLARFGRGGMIEEISNRLLNEFARSLQEMLAGDPAPASDSGPQETAPTEAVGTEAVGTEAPGTEAPVAAASPTPDSGEAAAQDLTAVAQAAEAAGEPAPAPAPSSSPSPGAPSSASSSWGSSSSSSSGGASEPIQGLSLVGSVLAARIKSNPGPVAALVVGFLLALRLLRRRG